MPTSAALPLDWLSSSEQDLLSDEDTPLPPHRSHRPSQSTCSSSDRDPLPRGRSANHRESLLKPLASRWSSSSQRGHKGDDSSKDEDENGNEDGNTSISEDQDVLQPPCRPLLREHSSPEPAPTPPQQTRSNWRVQSASTRSPPPTTFDVIPPPSTSSMDPRPTQASSWKLGVQHPEYLRNAWKYLLSVPGGMEWQELLKHYVQFEMLAPNDISRFCASSTLYSLSA